MSRSIVGRSRAILLATAVLAGVAGPLAVGSHASDLSLHAAAFTSEASTLEQQMSEHLFNGSVLSVHYRTPEQVPGDINWTSGGGDSGLWSGVYLAGESYRYAVAKHDLATATTDAARTAAQDEMASAMTRVRELAWAEHRRIDISGDWKPNEECSPSTVADGRNPAGITDGSTVAVTGDPNKTCGVSDPGTGLYGPGAVFRQCQPAGVDPIVQNQSASRPRQIFGPITWHVDGRKYYCEDGSSRDTYDGTTFGLLTAFDFVSGDDPQLRAQIRDDVESMTGYLAKHGWGVVRPHTSVVTEGSENFVFPLFTYTPSSRIAMASAARHVADLAGPDQQTTATFDALYDEEIASQGPDLPVDYGLDIQSPANGYYGFNLNHLINFDMIRTEPNPAIKSYLERNFSIVDAITKDDINAHFEAITYALTGEAKREHLAIDHLKDWIAYRNTPDHVVHNTPRCTATDSTHLDCVAEDDVDIRQTTPTQNLDVTVNENPNPTDPTGANATQRSTVPMPIFERPRQDDFIWQRSPYRLEGGADPNDSEPGVDYLTPYWMMRYYTDVAPPEVAPFPDYVGPTGGGSAATTHADSGFISSALHPYVGSLHEHSGYSDGWVGSTPGTYYSSGKKFGLDFMGGSDHSDFTGVPLSTSGYCAPDPNNPTGRDPVSQVTDTAQCPGGDPNDQLRSVDKWNQTKKYADAASDGSYTAFRGFEWTSDVYGHINVYFSKNYANAKADGYPTPKTFYDWLVRRPELGGGSDGIVTFNHPGAKDQLKPARQAAGLSDDTSLNWNDFAYDPRLDDMVAGMEVYNDAQEYGTTRDTDKYKEGYYAHVLDKGWHIGPIGAEDLGHRRSDDWGGPGWAKTVILADNDSAAALRAAMRARHFYAVRWRPIRIGFTVDGQMMGSRPTRALGSELPVSAIATWPGHTGLTLQLVTSKGKVLAEGTDALDTEVTVQAAQKYYFLRVKDSAGNYVAYSAPVWVTPSAAGHDGEWLAGDLHVHTCYSHDAYCPQGEKGNVASDQVGTPLDGTRTPLGDDNTDITLGTYATGASVNERFQEASLKGLDYLAITDHVGGDTAYGGGQQSVNDPGFGTHGVIGIPGYEDSIHGHAGMLGATHLYPVGDQSAAAIQQTASALQADGGIFQANHPAAGVTDFDTSTVENFVTHPTTITGLPSYLTGLPTYASTPRMFTDCQKDLGKLHWGYGYAVKVNSVEILNEGQYLQPPAPGNTPNEDGIRYWECWLDQGFHVAATGGSDSHWQSTVAIQGVGDPTTWVFAPERSTRGVLQGIREGRTSISFQAPIEGTPELVIEADTDHDGVYESMIGDTVPPGTKMRARIVNGLYGGLVDVRANDRTILAGAQLLPGGEVDFTAPAIPSGRPSGWVYATLTLPDGTAQRQQVCNPVVGGITTYCRDRIGILAITGAMYVAPPTADCVTPDHGNAGGNGDGRPCVPGDNGNGDGHGAGSGAGTEGSAPRGTAAGRVGVGSAAHTALVAASSTAGGLIALVLLGLGAVTFGPLRRPTTAART